MNTIDKIKESHLKARKERADTSFYSFVLSECQTVGKRKNRDSTEEEVQSVIKKLIANNEIAASHAIKISTEAAQTFMHEIVFLESLRPEMVDEEVLKSFIEEKCAGINIGVAMGLIKEKFGATVDMKIASEIFRSL